MLTGQNHFKQELNGYAPVCVVIPCFRCADTINRAVESVAAQTLKPAEVVLVDDASGDNTLDVLKRIELQYPAWIKVIALHENCGAASARNAGWAATNQPYVAFLDADDSWHPEKIDCQYRYMKNNPDIGLCGHLCAELAGGADVVPPTLPGSFHATKVSTLNLLFKTAFSTPTVMLKRDIASRFPEGKRYAEDACLWQLIAFSGVGVVRLEIPLAYLYKARYGSGGLSSSLWKMELGELANFYAHYRANRIGVVLLSLAWGFSLIKYGRRKFTLGMNRIIRNWWAEKI